MSKWQTVSDAKFLHLIGVTILQQC